jgi:hypothetical protein
MKVYNITFGKQGSIGVTGMNSVEYRKFLRVRKILTVYQDQGLKKLISFIEKTDCLYKITNKNGK